MVVKLRAIALSEISLAFGETLPATGCSETSSVCNGLRDFINSQGSEPITHGRARSLFLTADAVCAKLAVCSISVFWEPAARCRW